MLPVQRVVYAALATCFILAPSFKPATTYGKVVLLALVGAIIDGACGLVLGLIGSRLNRIRR